MRKYSNCRETDKLTDKLEGVVVDSGTDEDTVNKEEVESINGEETEAEAPDNNLLDLIIVEGKFRQI